MKITYIGHSGFSVEYDNVVFIFDYYRGNLPAFDRKKNIYVFVSHAHFDHFTKEIFTWSRIYPDITYILSADVPAAGCEGKILSMDENEKRNVEGVCIRTLHSTDEGVAFFVSAGGRTIYHAGDLNWWHWEEESADYNLAMEKDYKREIEKMKGQKVDVAFVPVDPRLADAFYYGIDWFMRQTDTQHVFPMHMQEDYEVYGKLIRLPETEGYRDKIVHIDRPSQTFELE